MRGTKSLAAALAFGAMVSGAARAQYTTTCPVFAVTATCQDTNSGSVSVSFGPRSTPTGQCAQPLSCNSQGASQTEACPSGGSYLINAAISEMGSCTTGAGPGNSCELNGVLVSAECAFAGTPGQSNCHGNTVSALSNQYDGLNQAASVLGYISVQYLQDAIKAYCGR